MQPRNLQYWPTWRIMIWRLKDSDKWRRDSLKLYSVRKTGLFLGKEALELVAFPEVNDERQDATRLLQRSREE
eukprot:12932111-Prorocentrum_lima.AAC.1